MARYSAAHYFLEGLVDLGVDYIFANLGTDHVSLIEEMARWDQQGRKHPEMILCPHEVVAVHMAGGYALATGRSQAVLVHVDAGTANACMAIQNLFRYRLPVMLFAGRAPHTLHGELTGSRDSYVHFVQDPFDIASIVRPYVNAGAAFQVFFTESTVDGADDSQSFANTTNQSDGTPAFTTGGGVYVPLHYGRVPVLLDLGATWYTGGRASYLKPGSIEDLPNSEIRVTPIESATPFVLMRLGVKIGR